jgi:hypothetical protein
MKRIYISGKITGLPINDVRAKFAEAKKDLEKQGYQAISPLETGIPYSATWETHLVADIILLVGCDAIYMLSDWENSKGATLERNIAEATGKEIIYQDIPVFLELKKAIHKAMNMHFHEIICKTRSYLPVFARIIFSHYCAEAGATAPEIAGQLKRDRTTIIYYLHKYADYYQFNIEFRHFADKTGQYIKQQE